MATLREKTAVLRAHVGAAKSAPTLKKIMYVEQTIEAALIVIDGLVDEIEKLKGGQDAEAS